MVKCPNCGSSAQVKAITPFVSDTGEYIDVNYVCGCGVYFYTEEK